MSIASDIEAEMNNKILERWVEKLQLAYDSKDWDLVSQLLEEMKTFHFTE